MVSVEVILLPKTQDDRLLLIHAEVFRNVRLRALKHDPQAFRANHKDESDKPIEFWVTRLRETSVQHVLAIQSGKDTSEPSVISAAMEAIGLAVIVQARNPAHQVNDSGSDTAMPTYILAAMWVDPRFRGQSVATKMIAKSVEHIKQSIAQIPVIQAHYCTTVARGNEAALKLYQNFGFKVDSHVNEDAAPAGELSMSMSIAIT